MGACFALGMYAMAAMKLYSYHVVNQWCRQAIGESKKRKKSLKKTPPSSPKKETNQKTDLEKPKGKVRDQLWLFLKIEVIHFLIFRQTFQRWVVLVFDCIGECVLVECVQSVLVFIFLCFLLFLLLYCIGTFGNGYMYS